ncbi:MAG: acylphosphatase [Methanomassiliicoccales archaeon]|nr:MAG: acylphosphatase [Methanomassiliicoccales archaeon]
MQIRAILTIKGDVQEAGYRVIIQKTALKMGFTGNAENLKNGDVKVVCECEEDQLDKFIEAITVRNDFISVENIEKKIEKATGEFESFDIAIGDMAFEMFQGYATAGKYFNWLGQKVDGVGKEVKVVGQKVDVVGQKVDNVGEKVDNLTVHTDDHFNKLDEKYGIVSETLISMNKEQTKTREELTRAVDSLNTLVNSVNILIKEHIEKEK